MAERITGLPRGIIDNELARPTHKNLACIARMLTNLSPSTSFSYATSNQALQESRYLIIGADKPSGEIQTFIHGHGPYLRDIIVAQGKQTKMHINMTSLDLIEEFLIMIAKFEFQTQQQYFNQVAEKLVSNITQPTPQRN